MLPGIMRRAKEKEQPEDQSREQEKKKKKKTYVPKNVKEKKRCEVLEASGKGVSLKGEAINL